MLIIVSGRISWIAETGVLGEVSALSHAQTLPPWGCVASLIVCGYMELSNTVFSKEVPVPLAPILPPPAFDSLLHSTLRITQWEGLF